MSAQGELLGVVTKTDRAEVRVYRRIYKGRATIDLRVWWLPDGQAEFVPSRKGFSVDASKLDALREALELQP